jgi:hypothetical protein
MRIRPTAQGLVPSERPGRRPSGSRFEGPVVATRPARDPSQPLHEVGLRVPRGEQAGPTRVVAPSQAGQPNHTGNGPTLPHPLGRERFEQRRSERQEAAQPSRPVAPPNTTGAREPAVTHLQPGAFGSRPEPPAAPHSQPRDGTSAGSRDEFRTRGGTFSQPHSEPAPRVESVPRLEPPPPPHTVSRPAPGHSYSSPAQQSGSHPATERREQLRARNPDEGRQPAPAPARAQRPQTIQPNVQTHRAPSSEPYRHQAPEMRSAPAQQHPAPAAQAGPHTSSQSSPHRTHQERINPPGQQ